MRIRFIIVIVIVLGASGYLAYWLVKRVPSSSNTNQTNAPVVAVNANVETVTTPPIVKGDRRVEKTVSYRDVTFELDTALVADAFRRRQAPDDSSYVVIFMKPFAITPPAVSFQWIGQEVRLVSSGGAPVKAFEVSIPNKSETASGYLWFVVPKGSKNLSLVFGPDKPVSTVELGF